MKASELIELLSEKIQEHGDLEVTNTFDSVIDDVVFNKCASEEYKGYLSLEDNGIDIEDFQNEFYEE